MGDRVVQIAAVHHDELVVIGRLRDAEGGHVHPGVILGLARLHDRRGDFEVFDVFVETGIVLALALVLDLGRDDGLLLRMFEHRPGGIGDLVDIAHPQELVVVEFERGAGHLLDDDPGRRARKGDVGLGRAAMKDRQGADPL